MMEYPINNSVDSGNHLRWKEANISTIPSPDIYNNVINVGPANTERNFVNVRDFSVEDLCALDYDIPDEYLHQCLKPDYLLPQNDILSTNNRKHGTSSSKVSKSMPAPINSSLEVHKKYIPNKLSFRSFPVKDFPHSKIQEKVDEKLIERKSIFIKGDYYDRSFQDAEILYKLNAGNEQELLNPPFQIKHVYQKHYPLIEIGNIIDENQLSSKIPDSFDQLNPFANANFEIGELNADMKSVNRSDKKNTSKKRKSRTKLTANQLFFLNCAFSKNHYLTSEMGKLLSKRLNIPEVCLKTWFQNQRARYKRMNLSNRNSCKGSGNFPTQNFNGI